MPAIIAVLIMLAAIVSVLASSWARPSAAAAAWRVVHSPFGRVLVSIRDNPARARALGHDVERYKLIAFVLSAGLAGLAGGVFAMSHGFVSLQELDWTTSGKVVLMTVIGGMGTLWGGPVGAAIIVLLFRKGVWGTGELLIARIGKAITARRNRG